MDSKPAGQQVSGVDSMGILPPHPKAPTPTHARISIASVWGVVGVILLLGNGLKRCLPEALQPFSKGLTPLGWVAYAVSVLFFAYAEGYRGFQQRFSPLVVRRSLLLDMRSPAPRQLLAPAYAMAFFHATRKRKIVSWALILGIAAVVALVKRLPYPHRAILDGGVCVGLSWGMGATAAIYLRSICTGRAPNADPCLPEP